MRITSRDRDLVTAVLIAVVLATLQVLFEASEWWFEFSRSYEKWELDEVFGIVVGVLAGSVWLSYRRRVAFAREIRKKAEIQAELDGFFDLSVDMLAVLDHDGRLQRVNRSVETLLGQDACELAGQPVSALIHDDDLHVLMAELYRLGAPGRTAGFRCRVQTANGPYRWFEWSLVSSEAAIYAVARDVTDRRNSEARLREMQQRLSDAVESIQDGFALWDSDDRLVMCNREYKRIYPAMRDILVPGVSFEAVVRQCVAEGAARNCRSVEERLCQRRRHDGPFEQQLADGRWVLVNERPTRSGGTVATQTDVTALKIVEEKLKEAERRLRFALDGSQDGLWDWNVGTGEIFRSPRFARILGFDPDELGSTRAGIIALVHPEDVQTFEDAGDRLTDGRSGEINIEVRVRAKGGNYRWLLSRGKVVERDPDGRPTRAVGTVTDISNVKQLQVAWKKAESSSNAKSEFLALMSHELRTPLNAIIGFSTMIKDQLVGPLDERYVEYASHVEVSGQHLLNIINDILDLAKIEAGRDELCEEVISLAELAKQVEPYIREKALVGQVRLAFDVDPDLVVRGDSMKLKRIVLNLLSNAVKFTRAGGTASCVMKRVAGAGITIEVIDTGVGIPDGEIEVALSKFGQVASQLTRGHEGTGLGLPLTQALVEQHGGQFDLKSEVGVGTTVTVTLPPERLVSRRQVVPETAAI